MQHGGQQQLNSSQSELLLLFEGLRERTKSKESHIDKVGPACIVEYLEDWIGKLVRDGYAIEKVLEIILHNSFQRPNRDWLERFLTNLKGNLNRRSLKPRICFPRIYIEKDEVETKEFLKQSYTFLENNEKILNLIMKTGYLWFNLSWELIEQQLKRNRLETKKILLESGENPKTVGVLFHSKQMRLSFNSYGDCLYILHFRTLLGLQEDGYEIVRDLVIGVVITQFKLCLVIFIALYEDSKKVEKTMGKGENEEVRQKGEDNQKQEDNIQIDSVVYFVLSSVFGEFLYKPIHIMYFFRNSEEINSNCRSKYFYSQSTQTNKFHQSIISSTIIRASSNRKYKELSSECRGSKIKNFIGIYSNQNNDHMAQIFSFINNSLTNHQFCFESILWKIKDRCQLLTYLLKVVLCLQQQSIYKRESASQLSFSFYGGALTKSDKRNEQDSYFDEQIHNLKETIYAKPILKHILEIIKDTTNYSVKQPQYYEFSKTIKLEVKKKGAEEVYSLLFYMEWNRWECSCFYIYHTGIPCCHIIKALEAFKGQISYYVHERWKNPCPKQLPKQRKPTMKQTKIKYPVTNNKGLIRLASLYRNSFFANQV